MFWGLTDNMSFWDGKLWWIEVNWEWIRGQWEGIESFSTSWCYLPQSLACASGLRRRASKYTTTFSSKTNAIINRRNPMGNPGSVLLSVSYASFSQNWLVCHPIEPDGLWEVSVNSLVKFPMCTNYVCVHRTSKVTWTLQSTVLHGTTSPRSTGRKSYPNFAHKMRSKTSQVFHMFHPPIAS